MKKIFGSAAFKVIAVLLCAAICGSVAAMASEKGSSPFSNALGTVFTPLKKISAAICNSMADFGGYFVSSDYYLRRAEQLEDEIADLQKQLVDYEQMKQKLASYESFLELKQHNPDFQFASGSVIARDAADLYYSFVLDCGSADGVKVNDPVIFGSYLAGVVKEVRTSSCVVKTFLDPGVSVSAYEVRSREEGFVSGNTMLAFDGSCRLSGLARSTSVAKGGIVCTSGIGGIYPRDLMIGTVVEVADENADISSYAVLTPGIDFNELTDAFVLIGFAGKGE